MNVRQILTAKGSSAVESVADNEPVATAANALATKGIGALVVLGHDTALVGIISERDLVRALDRDGTVCLTCPVSKYMTREVVCANPTDALDTVLETMTSKRFRHMPVMEDNKLVGVISIGDAVKARIAGLEQENAALADWIKGG